MKADLDLGDLKLSNETLRELSPIEDSNKRGRTTLPITADSTLDDDEVMLLLSNLAKLATTHAIEGSEQDGLSEEHKQSWLRTAVDALCQYQRARDRQRETADYRES